MKCKASFTTATDLGLWVSAEKFLEVADSSDIACRNSQSIEDKYHPQWFLESKDGHLRFIPPAFYFKNGAAYFINGRHRALLLARHLQHIPTLLTAIDSDSRDSLSKVKVSDLSEDEVFILPDLPFNYEWKSDSAV